MMVRGGLLHRLARGVCTPAQFESIVEPAIADLQVESQQRITQPTPQRIAALVLGYAAVWKVIALCVVIPARSIDESRALKRILGWTALATFAALAPLIVIPLVGFPASPLRRALLGALISQSLTLALPAGLTFGVALGLAGVVRSRQHARDVLMLAAATAIVNFALLGWWMPAANHAFRQATGGGGQSAEEMSLPNVRRQAALYESRGDVESARHFRWSLHTRVALPAAALALPAFLLGISDRRIIARVATAFIACFGYWVALVGGGSLIVIGWSVPAAIAAWLPNVMFGGGALLLRRS